MYNKLAQSSINYFKNVKKLINKKVKLTKNTRVRFAPEPNGILHIGHVKNIYINYVLSKYTKGKLNIRIDDSNPKTSKVKWIKGIIHNLIQLKFLNKKTKVTFTSNYFTRIKRFTKILIKKNLSYIDSQNIKTIKKLKGDFYNTGKRTSFIKRTTKEKLYLFKRMIKGLYKENEFIIRIFKNMRFKNIQMRDPIIYRIIFTKHFKTQHKYFIYPTYDIAHSLSDRIEKINISICSDEFKNNNGLYQWFIDKYNTIYKKDYLCNQFEFPRLEIKNHVTSKRQINRLNKKNKILNWIDNKLLTINNLISKGMNSKVIKTFIKEIGLSKKKSKIGIEKLNKLFSKYLTNKNYEQIISISNPIKIIILNEKTKFNKEIIINRTNLYKKKVLTLINQNKKQIKIKFIKKNLKTILFYYNKHKSDKTFNFIYKSEAKKATIKINKNNKIVTKSIIINKPNSIQLGKIIQIINLGFFKITKIKQNECTLIPILMFKR